MSKYSWKVKVMNCRQRGHHGVFPPPCEWCGEPIEEGDEYLTGGNRSHTKYYHKNCKLGLYN